MGARLQSGVTLGLACAVVGMLSGLTIAQPEFTPLEMPPGGVRADAYAVSADGSTVVGSYRLSSGEQLPCRWPVGAGVESLGSLASFTGFGNAHKASADGGVIAGGSPSDDAMCTVSEEAFTWTASGGMQGLGFAIPECKSWAYFISDDARVVAGATVFTGNQYHPGVQVDGGLWQPIPGAVSQAASEYVLGGSPDGDHLVGSVFDTADTGLPAWVYHRQTGVFQEIHDLAGGATYIEALDVDPGGSKVVGRATSGGFEAFLWTPDTGTFGLGDFTTPAVDSRAWAIDADLIVGFGSLGGERIAAIWEPDLLIRRLDEWLTARGVVIPAGWVLRVPRDIRRVGDHVMICGSGTNPAGDTAAWLVKAPIGAPCSAADFAEPFGALDFSDVIAFLGAFAAMDPSADLAEPTGAYDFSDIVAFLTLFGAGCP